MKSSFGITLPSEVKDEIRFISKINFFASSIMRFSIQSHGNWGVVTNEIYRRRQFQIGRSVRRKV
jgi:hypothetical protein